MTIDGMSEAHPTGAGFLVRQRDPRGLSGATAPDRRVPPSVAVVNEWFEATGGAERVLLAMIDALPGCDPWVLWREAGAEAPVPVRESWLARTPLRGRKDLALPLIPFVWRTQTRQRYDVVLSLSHALNHTARLPVNEGGVHLSYVHTPARYLWLPHIDKRKRGLGHSAAVAVTKRLELRMSRHVTSYAANSREVQRRIQEFWGAESRVINPPVRTAWLTAAPEDVTGQNRDYLLAVGRWVLYKNFEFVIEVAARAGLPLVLAGGGPMEAELRRQARARGVEARFEVRPTDERVRELLYGAKALIFPTHEDFGIVPVEAQACGTPVIGLRAGGLLETVTDGRTGHLVDRLDAALFADRLRRLDELSSDEARANAARFSQERFTENLLSWIADSVPR